VDQSENVFTYVEEFAICLQHAYQRSESVAIDRSRDRCAVWVCTIVHEAVDRFQRLGAELGDDAMLFHSRYRWLNSHWIWISISR